MHKTLLLLSAFMLLISATKPVMKVYKKAEATDEARSAFDYLNKVRSNPAAYSKEIGVDLSDIKPMHQLVWNDTLARVATAKAMDMAKRNYFDHVDPDGCGLNIKISAAGYKLNEKWTSLKSKNNFESISAGIETGIGSIQSLIADSGTYPPGHRIHLLGLNPFWENCYDIGIGFVQGGSTSTYGTYCCVIIAKHDF